MWIHTEGTKDFLSLEHRRLRLYKKRLAESLVIGMETEIRSRMDRLARRDRQAGRPERRASDEWIAKAVAEEIERLLPDENFSTWFFVDPADKMGKRVYPAQRQQVDAKRRADGKDRIPWQPRQISTRPLDEYELITRKRAASAKGIGKYLGRDEFTAEQMEHIAPMHEIINGDRKRGKIPNEEVLWIAVIEIASARRQLGRALAARRATLNLTPSQIAQRASLEVKSNVTPEKVLKLEEEGPSGYPWGRLTMGHCYELIDVNDTHNDRMHKALLWAFDNKYTDRDGTRISLDARLFNLGTPPPQDPVVQVEKRNPSRLALGAFRGGVAPAESEIDRGRPGL